ncbi:MAG: hypothetical protein AAF608_13620 [Pseudomonadota bacterium]
MTNAADSLSPVAMWRIHLLRLLYVAIAVGLHSFVWQQLFFQSADWPLMRGIAKSMFAALGLLVLFGIRYPLQMLPLIFFETLWKAIWIVAIAIPAALNGRWAVVESTFYECIGIVLVFAVMPWRYVWARYVTHTGEPWRRT